MRLAAFLPALLLAIPAATAAMEMEANVTFATDFEWMDMEMDMEISGSDAAQMRQGIDQMGDNDGRVTQEEADAFLQGIQDSMRESFEGSTGDITLDGNEPKDFEVQEMEFIDIEGQATSTSQFVVHAKLHVTLDPEGSGDHTLLMKDSNDGESGPDMKGTITFRAPSGYRIDSFTEMEGASLSADGRVLTVADVDSSTEGDMRIVFETSGSSGSPAPAAGVLAALLGAAAVGARRRRA
jgi:hypothetical protein